MHAEVNVFSNRELPFFGCELIVNQLKYGGEEAWNHLQIRCSVSISCFKDLVDEENYLFSPTSSSSFSALSFFTRNTLAISSVFVVLYLYFNFFVSCESLDSENKQANIIKNNSLKEKKWCLCALWSKDSHHILATVLIWDSPNFIGKVFYNLHNITLFSFYL